MVTSSAGSTALEAAESALAVLASEIVVGRPGSELADRLLRVQRLTHVLQSALLTATAAFDSSGEWERDHAVGAAGWLRARAQLPAGVARAQVRDARVLRDSLPLSSQALADGAISLAHVKVMTSVCEKNDERRASIAAAEPVLVDAARRVDPTAFRQVVARWTCAVDPDAARLDDAELHASRYLSISSTYGGMVALDGLLDPEGGAVILEAMKGLTALSRTRDDVRTPRQRRADALVELASFSLDHGDVPQVGGERPHVMVSIPVSVVLGSTTGGAELLGRGALTADAAWRYLCDASLVPILEDDAGGSLDVGRARRTIPPSLRRAIVRRDGHCVFAGCDRPVDWCDVHHIVTWAQGGSTSLDNCVLLCRLHHRAIHQEGYSLRGRAGPAIGTYRPDGTLILLEPHSGGTSPRPPVGPPRWPPESVA